jgi:enoyl-CoA hydratase
MLIERREDVAFLRLRGGKANSMSREFLTELVALVERAENEGARAIVLSGYEKFFSAGLALPSLVELDRTAMREFIELFSNAMLRIFRSELPVIAAVNGHAIAGGCVLALMADVRLIADTDLKIGLNEVQLGIGLPSIVVEPLKLQIPPSSWVRIVYEGNLFPAKRAHELGLADELVRLEELEGRAFVRAKDLTKAPKSGVAQVKAAIRRPVIEAVEARGPEEREKWLDTWFSPAARELIRSTVERLKR